MSASNEYEERFRALAEAAFDGIFVLDGARITYANSAGLELFGYGLAELIGHSALELAAPESRPAVAASIQSGQLTPYEAVGIRKDGSRFPGELRGRSFDLGGRHMRVTAIRDLTERKRVERALARNEARLASVVQQLPLLVWTTDRELQVTSHMGRSEVALGFRPNEAVGSTPAALFANHEALPAVEGAHKRAQAGEQVVFDVSFGGRDYHAIVEPLRDGGGHPEGVMGVALDITERRAAERKTESSLSLLRATLESTVEGIVAVDLDLKIRAYNQRFLETWGLSERLMQARDDELARDHAKQQMADPEAFNAGVRDIYQHPEIETFDVLELRDGRVLERASRPQRVGDKIVGRVWSFRDVTAARRVEAERDRLLGEAREAIRLRDEFLSIASHELYTPLCSLTLALQSLRGVAGAAPLDDSQRTRLSAVAERQTSRLANLVNALLDVARIESGRLELNLEEVDLAQLLHDVVERFAPDLERAGSQVTVQAPAPVRGQWDRSRIDQVVTNLIGNAIKYGGGRPIEVAVEPALPAGARLRVTDQGTGIDPAQQARVFERFARATSSRHFGGLGLGLYIVRRAIEAHHGRIEVESTPGRGSTFTVVLP